jgi:hypothetical protein
LRAGYGGDDSDLGGVWRAAEELTVVTVEVPTLVRTRFGITPNVF